MKGLLASILIALLYSSSSFGMGTINDNDYSYTNIYPPVDINQMTNTAYSTDKNRISADVKCRRLESLMDMNYLLMPLSAASSLTGIIILGSSGNKKQQMAGGSICISSAGLLLSGMLFLLIYNVNCPKVDTEKRTATNINNLKRNNWGFGFDYSPDSQSFLVNLHYTF